MEVIEQTSSRIVVSLSPRRWERLMALEKEYNKGNIQLPDDDTSIRSEGKTVRIKRIMGLDNKKIASRKALYLYILKYVEEKKLYQNPEFNLIALAEEIDYCRTAVSSCINRESGKTFSRWLADFRLRIFVAKLKKNPTQSIDQLMKCCGYRTSSTFSRQFKKLYGMTAYDYRQMLITKKTAHR